MIKEGRRHYSFIIRKVEMQNTPITYRTSSVASIEIHTRSRNETSTRLLQPKPIFTAVFLRAGKCLYLSLVLKTGDELQSFLPAVRPIQQITQTSNPYEDSGNNSDQQPI
jgi:hypothetical protein